MTKLSIFLFLAIFIAGCNYTTQMKEKAPDSQDSAAELVEIKLSVQGMTCEGCENAIVGSLSRINGVYESSASHLDEMVTIKYNPAESNIDLFTEAITRAGYKVIDVVEDKVDNK